MKKFNLITKITFAFLFATILFSACKNDFDDTPIEAAAVGFVHASPGTGALDFIVDNQKIGNFTYTEDKGYYSAYPGARIVGVAKKDTLKYLTNVNTSFAQGKAYSIFVVDTLKKTSLLIVEDDLKAPETDKAKIRFINLSPSSAPFDLKLQDGTTPLFTAKAFKESTAFVSITPSDNYAFQLNETGNATPVATLPTVKIEKGKIYTIWAKGLKTATDSTKLDLSIMSNN